MAGILYLAIPELRDPALLAHHVITAALSVLGLHPVAFAHFYDLYFAGVAELSNVPLAFIEAGKLIPQLKDRCPRTSEAASIAFTASFFILRLLCWPTVSLFFWSDTIAHINEGTIHATSVAAFYLLSNTALTAMQLVWGWKLLRRTLGLRRRVKRP
eukprot:CAMPEP_0181185802 /NCGR_PEP_ID=MMETSP1096-20121128/9701_1 /TAXON_ID=156174 ORGANISM="Chrysochromulina ericina, Strain CCMP281" /NCGR_SAMPLE_ID=MMETSP1096 /ASSEMBLY_ACC=CAM_ASM_000453 /LENGTH=156 /DNA_ID=CAMNT_0023274669 /DNA_START=437 /DNA_END=907 /DNA_ORIENTATION=-